MQDSTSAADGACPGNRARTFMALLRSPGGVTCSGFLFTLPGSSDATACGREIAVQYVMTVAHFLGEPVKDHCREGLRRVHAGIKGWGNRLWLPAEDRPRHDQISMWSQAARISVRIGNKYYFSTCYGRVPGTDIAILKLDRPVKVAADQVPVLDLSESPPLRPGGRFVQYGFGARRLVERKGRLLFPLPWAGSRGLSTSVRHAYFTHVSPKVVRGDSGGPILLLSSKGFNHPTERLKVIGVQSMIHDPWGIDAGIAVIARIRPHRTALMQLLDELHDLSE